MKKTEIKVESSLIFWGFWIGSIVLIWTIAMMLEELHVFIKIGMMAFLGLLSGLFIKELTNGTISIKNTGKELAIEWVKKPILTTVKARNINLQSIEDCTSQRNSIYEILRFYLASGEVIVVTSSDKYDASGKMRSLAKKYGKKSG